MVLFSVICTQCDSPITCYTTLFLFFVVHNSVHEKSSFNRAQLLNSRSAETFDIYTFIKQEKLAVKFSTSYVYIFFSFFSVKLFVSSYRFCSRN